MHSVALDYLAPIPLNISEDCINKCYTESESIICLSLRVFCEYRGDFDKVFFSLNFAQHETCRQTEKREKRVKLAEMPFFWRCTFSQSFSISRILLFRFAWIFLSRILINSPAVHIITCVLSVHVMIRFTPDIKICVLPDLLFCLPNWASDCKPITNARWPSSTTKEFYGCMNADFMAARTFVRGSLESKLVVEHTMCIYLNYISAKCLCLAQILWIGFVFLDWSVWLISRKLLTSLTKLNTNCRKGTTWNCYKFLIHILFAVCSNHTVHLRHTQRKKKK